MVKIDGNKGLVVGKLVSIADNGTQIVGTTKSASRIRSSGVTLFAPFTHYFHGSYKWIIELVMIDPLECTIGR